MLAPRTVFSDLERVKHDEDFRPQPAAQPTTAMPGSAAKIEVLRRRVERGESLWHPSDNRTPAEPIVKFAYQPGIREVALPALG